MKYARVPMRVADGSLIRKVVKGRILCGAFEILEECQYPDKHWPLREIRMVELINEREYFKAILNGEG